MENQNKALLKNNTILWIVIGVLLVVVGYLFYVKKEKEVVVDELVIEKELLARDFRDLAMDYDSLQTNNDTINVLLSKERERVAQLIEELRVLKASNSSQIAQYKKELASLRNIMRNFVVQIDSLNSRNQVLTAENIQVKQQINQIKESNQVLEKEKQNLVQKVEIAARLETRDLFGEGLNNKGKETNRIGRVDKIRVCFVILKNITAKVGEKTVYLRLMRPDGALLFHSATDVFQFEGSRINFSASRVIEYGGNDLDVCVFYKVEEGELIAGKYTADLFADGNNIGTVTFELK